MEQRACRVRRHRGLQRGQGRAQCLRAQAIPARALGPPAAGALEDPPASLCPPALATHIRKNQEGPRHQGTRRPHAMASPCGVLPRLNPPEQPS